MSVIMRAGLIIAMIVGAGLAPTAVSAAATGVIAGTVTGDVVRGWDPTRVTVGLYDGSYSQIDAEQLQPDGSFSFGAYPTGQYSLWAHWGGDEFLDQTWQAQPAVVSFTWFTLSDGQVVDAEIAMHPSAQLSGTVVGPDGSVPQGITVLVTPGQGPIPAQYDESTGAWSLRGLKPGPHTISVDVVTTPGVGDYGVQEYRDFYWPNGRTPSTAVPIAVGLGEIRSDLDIVLPLSATLSGVLETIGAGGAQTVPDTLVTVERNGQVAGTDRTDSSGRFGVDGLNAGSYTISWGSDIPTGTGPDLLPGVHSGPDGQPVVITIADGENANIGGVVGIEAARIEGNVSAQTASGSFPVGAARVVLYRLVPQGYYSYETEVQTNHLGDYVLAGLQPGAYRVEFKSGSTSIGPVYWPNERLWRNAEDITLSPGSVFTDINAVLHERQIDTPRLAGPDRFATAVEISKAFNRGPSPTPVVYIANGLNYPDALAAGPAAAVQGGALLLTPPNSLPAAVVAELTRLNPERIVVVGSESAVSAGVFTQLKTFVDSPADLDRLGGADRYATADLVVRDAFDTVAFAFVATGGNYPDALAAGAAAGSRGFPVLLVNGGGSSLTPAARDLISDLGIEQIGIVGSGASVSNPVALGIVDELGDGNVWRYAGVDRYDTAVRINRAVFSESDNALLATGANFADALAGGPLAAWWGAPLFLSRPDCVPQDVYLEMLRLDVREAYLLGSSATLSNNVKNLALCPAG